MEEEGVLFRTEQRNTQAESNLLDIQCLGNGRKSRGQAPGMTSRGAVQNWPTHGTAPCGSGSGGLGSCPFRCWPPAMPPLCDPGVRKLPPELLAPELCHLWTHTSKTMPWTLPLGTHRAVRPFPAPLPALLWNGHTVRAPAARAARAWALSPPPCCSPSLVPPSGHTRIFTPGESDQWSV